MDPNKADKFRKEIHHSAPEDFLNDTQNKTENNIPIIRTLESDILDQVKAGELDQRKILTEQLDSKPLYGGDIYAAADKVAKRKKIILYSSLVLTILLVVGGILFYNYWSNLKNQTPTAEVPIKKYTVNDIWINPPIQLVNYTGEATTTKDSIIVKIKDFNSLYYYSLNNETIFNQVAKDLYNYNTLGNFSDISIENNDLRIADGGNGPLVYGFLDKNYLIVSNGIDSWIRESKDLKQ